MAPVGGDNRRVVVRRAVAWAFIQWDTQSDVDLPAGDSHFLDHGSEQLLALVEVQAVEGGDRPLGERTDPLAQAVVLGERIPLLGKGLVLLGDAASPAIEFLGPALQLHELDQPGLVEVEQPAALGLGGLGPCSVQRCCSPPARSGSWLRQ